REPGIGAAGATAAHTAAARPAATRAPAARAAAAQPAAVSAGRAHLHRPDVLSSGIPAVKHRARPGAPGEHAGCREQTGEQSSRHGKNPTPSVTLTQGPRIAATTPPSARPSAAIAA